MTSANETRILKAPSLAARYTLVTMPRTAWYWLDDLVRRKYPTGGYHALIEAFQKTERTKSTAERTGPESLSRHLSAMAENHSAARMATLYHLSNDNVTDTPRGIIATDRQEARPDYTLRLPTVFRLFRFMPHATYLTTVWERRNYHLTRPAPEND